MSFASQLYLGLVIAAATIAADAQQPLSPAAHGERAQTVEALTELSAFWLRQGGGNRRLQPARLDGLKLQRLAKAKPDECFIGIGEANQYPFDFQTADCQGRPKVNESYVFGLTRSGDTLWLGSAPNMGCLVYGTIAQQGVPGGLIELQTKNSVCEYAAGVYGQVNGLPDHLADWRPPSIYSYDLSGGQLAKVEIDDSRLSEVLGIRAAGALGNLVFLAGPYITGMGGPDVDGAVYMFAFRGDTGEYLGSARFAEYLNIRKWVVVDDVLYTGVMIKKDAYPNPDTAPGGAILRWTGTLANPFVFEVVGLLDGDPVELAEHEGRLFAATWPDFGKLFEDAYDYAGLWMSPVIDAQGLDAQDAEAWTKVWSARDYEPDEVAARMYNGGALASFDGYLVWGTTHAPMSAGLAHAQTYGLIDPDNPDEADFAKLMRAVLALHRPISIFRGRDFGSPTQSIDVLYGLETMPAYVADADACGPEQCWKDVPNGIGPPLFGTAGFGNLFNTYTWTMEVFDDRLFVGTMDWSHMLMGIIVPAVLQDVFSPFPEIQLPRMTFGADVFVFGDADTPARLLTDDGFGNRFSYGVRTMLSGANGLYLGMANASNIATDLQDRLPEGGWELIEITPRRHAVR